MCRVIQNVASKQAMRIECAFDALGMVSDFGYTELKLWGRRDILHVV